MDVIPDNDYQRPPGTPAPEGRTAARTPFPGWMRNLGSGWLGRWSGRELRAAGIERRRQRWEHARRELADSNSSARWEQARRKLLDSDNTTR